MDETRCSVFIAHSVDGFIARPDGGIDWLSIVEAPGEDYGYAAFFATVDALLIGRKTYELALGFEPWPYEGKRLFVLTTSERTAKHGERFVRGTPAEVKALLSAEGVKRAYVDGGNVIQQFLAAGAIDDLTLSQVPILLGAGVRLFGELKGDLRLDLERSRSFPSGLVQNEYALRRSGTT